MGYVYFPGVWGTSTVFPRCFFFFFVFFLDFTGVMKNQTPVKYFIFFCESPGNTSEKREVQEISGEYPGSTTTAWTSRVLCLFLYFPVFF
jgi:hypothetical protein